MLFNLNKKSKQLMFYFYNEVCFSKKTFLFKQPNKTTKILFKETNFSEINKRKNIESMKLWALAVTNIPCILCICGSRRKTWKSVEHEPSSSSCSFFYECSESSDECRPCRPSPRPCPSKWCRPSKDGIALKRECVQSLKQAELLLRNLYTASNKLIRTIFDSLSTDLKTATNAEKSLALTEFTRESSELEKTVLQILECALMNIKTGASSLVAATSSQLQKQIEFNTATALADYVQQFNALLNLPDATLTPIVRDLTNGLLPRTSQLFAQLNAANNALIEKVTNEERIAIGALLDSEMKDAITAITKAFKAFVNKYKIYANAQTEILIKSICEILSKAEKALISSLDGALIGNFRFIEFLIRRCVEALSPCGQSDCAFPPILINPALIQNPVIQ